MQKTVLVSSFCLLIVLCSLRFGLCLEVPALSKRVTDEAQMLSQGTRAQLENSLAELEKTDSTQIAVLTIPSLEGENLEEFSLKTAEKWQLGHDGRDNGVLLLIARKERKIRIEVGYGLEGVLTDLTAGRIIRNVIVPRFRSGNVDQGVIDGITAISAAVHGEFKAEDYTGKNKANTGDLLILLGFVLFFVGRLMSRNKIAAGTTAAIVLPAAAWLFTGATWPFILALAPAGFVLGLLAAFLVDSIIVLPGTGGLRQRGGSLGRHTFGGRFGGGGFSGGGGGFGGGGASGGW